MIEEAIDFATTWPEEFRVPVFQVALARLMRLNSYEPENSRAPARHDALVEPSPSVDAGQALASLGRSFGIGADEMARVVAISGNGHIRILGRLDGDSKRELQRGYSNVYAFVKEQAFGELHMDVEELRQLCSEHGCYDSANFTANFRLDNLLREVGGKGAKERRYVASKTGLMQGEALLREMLSR